MRQGGFRLIVEIGGSSAALLGLAEMKTGKQRGVVSAAVLDAPEQSYASAEEPAWRGQSPAPAGALQRGYAANSGPSGYNADAEDDDYHPRRGAFRPTVRGLFRSKGGRIVLASTIVVLLGVLAAGLVVARAYLLRDPRFVIAESDDIQISGNTHLTRAQLLDVFGGDLERNIFRVSLADRKADLERLPWIQHATVMRLLPNQLRVQIVERTPVGFSRQGTQIGLVDASGVLLDMGAESHYSFPVLTGIQAADPLSTRAARMNVYLRFMKELDGGGDQFTKTVSEVDVSDPDDLKAMIATGGPELLVHFGDEQFLSRYKQFEKLVPGWKQQYPKLASVDMRYPGQIVLEMRKDADASSAQAEVAATPHSPATQPHANVTPTPTAPAQALVANAAEPAPKSAAAPAAKPKSVSAKVPAKKPLAKTVAGKASKPTVKPAVAHASGSAANDKFYAALAAQRKAAETPR